MGICNNKTEKMYKNHPNNQKNQQYSSQIVSQVNVDNTIKSYPKGKVNLLKKIQGAIISNDKLKSRVELYVNLLKIPVADSYSIEVSIIEKGNKKKIASLNKEHSDSNNQVMFKNYIEMDYFFERDQTIEFLIFSSTNRVMITEKVAKIAGSSKKGYQNEQIDKGMLLEVLMIPIKSETKMISFEFEIVDSNKENASKISESIFKSNEIFYVLKNFNDNKNWRSVYKSEESNNCKFELSNIFEDDLFLGDNNKKFKFEICHSTRRVVLAYCELSISEIESLNGFIPLNILTNGSINSSFEGKYFVQTKLTTIEKLNFAELLKKGLQISLIVGIDFTGSNGDPNLMSSLHYIKGSNPNSYERSIRACGNILAYYDSDNMYPLFGFGGVPYGKVKVDHSFPLNFSSDPSVHGIDEMINVYKHAITVCQLSGPTNFAPLIQSVSSFVSSQQEGNYFVLMIITDGEICDIDDTIDAIVNASYLPLSIIIVGVGSSSFEAMNILDGDDLPLRSSNGRPIHRDIVQFVPFNKYENNPELLAEEVLKELPDQIEIYYRDKQVFR